MSVLVLSEHDVRSLLTMSECIEAMDEVLRSLAQGELHQPLRPVTRPEGSDTLMGLMPAFRGGERPAWSLKEIVIAPGNPARGLDAHQGAVLLHDGETGQLRALLNASAITEIRTAAVSAVATRALARPEAAVVAILGGGVQARSHDEAMRAVLPHAEIRAWTRGGGGTPEEVLRDADVVCTCTSCARADPRARLAEAGSPRERGRIERAECAGAGRGDGRRRRPSSSTGANRR